MEMRKIIRIVAAQRPTKTFMVARGDTPKRSRRSRLPRANECTLPIVQAQCLNSWRDLHRLAKLTVKEDDDHGLRFAPYVPFPANWSDATPRPGTQREHAPDEGEDPQIYEPVQVRVEH
jgi:hypothetical protein